MAYQTHISGSDRSGAVLGVIAIHAVLVLVFMHLAGKMDLPDRQSVLSVFNLQPPPPPPPPPPQVKVQPKAAHKEGASSPPNIRNQATEVKAPKPKVVVPPRPQIAAAVIPNKGAASNQGASAVPGNGAGAGGSGSGTGSGTQGNGSGGGGDNGVAEPPRLVSPVLSGRDFPQDMLQQWPHGATVFLRLRVDSAGYVSECTIDRGTGVASIDSQICALAHERLRFSPALNRGGQAVAGWFGYAQRAPV